MTMTMTHDESAVMLKTRELCETLVADPGFSSIRDRIGAFLADEAARDLYDRVNSLGQALQQKQRAGHELSDAEIADFEGQRANLLGNPAARGFLDAQEEMQEVRQAVLMHVMKTFELGRVPEAGDFHSCGAGCSCG